MDATVSIRASSLARVVRLPGTLGCQTSARHAHANERQGCAGKAIHASTGALTLPVCSAHPSPPTTLPELLWTPC